MANHDYEDRDGGVRLGDLTKDGGLDFVIDCEVAPERRRADAFKAVAVELELERRAKEQAWLEVEAAADAESASPKLRAV